MSWDLASLGPVQRGPIDQHFLEVSFSLLPQFPLPRAKGGPVPQTLPHCPCTATPGLALAQQLPHPQQWPSSQVGRVSWAWCQAPRLSGSHQPLTQTRAGAATRPPSRVPLSSGQLWLGGASAEAGPELPWGCHPGDSRAWHPSLVPLPPALFRMGWAGDF